MRDDLMDTLRDCANALGELLPRNHVYRKIVDQANRLIDRYDQSSSEQRAADALRDLMHALPEFRQAVMAMWFCPRCEWRPCECEGQYADAHRADAWRAPPAADEHAADADSDTPIDYGAWKLPPAP